MILIYQTETDGEQYIVEVTQKEIQKIIKKYNLPFDAYAVFEGKILKTFNQTYIIKNYDKNKNRKSS